MPSIFFGASRKYNYQQIVSQKAPDILFTADGWLYIVGTTEEKSGFPRDYFSSSAQFYAYAETLHIWQAKQIWITPVSNLLTAISCYCYRQQSYRTYYIIRASGVSISIDVATFSVTASGTGPLNYQWQRNNVDIFGANSSSITPPAQASNNGDQYTVRSKQWPR